jgi:periplasmic protein TonB
MKLLLFSLSLFLFFTGSGQIINRNIEPEDPYPYKIVGTDTVYKSVPDMPVYPGGDNKFMEFLGANIKYPAESREKRITGKVFVGFTVKADGNISNLEIIKSLNAACDQEVVRVMNLMPAWTPGKLYGNNVNVQMIMPINFSLR